MPHPLAPAQLNALNLKVLRRHCPQITDIYDQASYVVLYRSILKNPDDPESKAREWSKKDVHVEGSMFLVEYDTPPPHGFYILNREGLSDFKHVFRAGDKFEYKSDFIIFQGEGSAEIWGLWVFEPDQRKRLADKFLYYHQLELDPGTAAPPETPVLLPSGKPQPQTVDELFQGLLGPSTSTNTASSSPAPPTSAPAPAPPLAAGSAQGPPTRQQGRRRGESVSGKDSAPPAKQILTASTGPGAPRGREPPSSSTGTGPGPGPSTTSGKGKKPRRPKSVPPQQDANQEEQLTNAQLQGQMNGHPAQGLGREGIADFAAALAGQDGAPQDPTMSLKQIFGLLSGPAPAAPTPPASALLAQSQASGTSAGVLHPPAQGQGREGKEKEKEKEGKNGHARKKSAHLPPSAVQNQYIPQPALNSQLLVAPELVKDALADKMAQAQAQAQAREERECISQREFVQEVLRLIHTDREWTKGLWEEYVRRTGSGEVRPGPG